MKVTESISKEYVELLNQQKFEEKNLNYNLLEKHKTFLNQLALVSNSGIIVFDLYKQDHVFASYNFKSLFGYDFSEMEINGNDYFASITHHDDLTALAHNAIALFKFICQLPKKERIDFKLKLFKVVVIK